ncbi:MAG: nucleotidyltransferase [Candidatus Pacebacteria bacterium]|nr:nucleotidyltransferase [Candidatus Paceibacterota bacterium]
MLKHVFKDQDKLRNLCQKHGIIKLALFDEKYYPSELMPDHHLIMLVEFVPDKRIGYYGFLGIADELSELLDGQQIDLRTSVELKAYHRQEMLDSAVVQYAA